MSHRAARVSKRASDIGKAARSLTVAALCDGYRAASPFSAP